MTSSENNRVLISHNICTQTKTCISACTLNAIEMSNGYPYITKDCNEPCMACVSACPAIAIRLK